MEKITDIIDSIANEKSLPSNDVKERVLHAFCVAAKRLWGAEYEYEASIDQSSKSIKLYQKILVVSDDDERLDERNFISLNTAHATDADLEIGDSLNYELNIDEHGRTAAAAFYKEIEFHIQRLVEEKIFERYNSKVGEIAYGTVSRVDSEQNTFAEIGEIRAIMTMRNRIKDEKFSSGDTLKAVIKTVRFDKNDGIKIELSRTTPKFLEALLRAEVPEIKDGQVLIQGCARIPGRRAKVALQSISPNVDAVGATVGVKGIRINAVSSELNGENIDAIEYSPEPSIFIARALSPAIISAIKLEDKKAIVSLLSDQKPKAIGSAGINIRLASMLTGYEIELIDLGENASKQSQEKSNEEGLKSLKALFGE